MYQTGTLPEMRKDAHRPALGGGLCMDRSQPDFRTRRKGLRRLIAQLGVTSLPWLAVGCAQLTPDTLLDTSRSQSTVAPEIVQVRAQAAEPETAPQPNPDPNHARVVPISLDTVLRLAEEQN